MRIKVGKYVDTHGIKGEIRLISYFTRKDLVFIPDFKIYIKDKEFEILSYRHHKQYDMLTLKDVNSINDIEYLKGYNVYVESTDLESDYDAFMLTNYKVIIDNKTYNVKDVIDNSTQKLIVLDNEVLIPYVDDFIIKKDDINKEIYMNVPDGLI